MSKSLVFVAPPFAGHLYPLIPLAEAVRDAGYRVTFLTGAKKIETLRRAGFSADSLNSLSATALEEIANQERRIGSNPFLLAKQMRQAFALIGAAKGELVSRWSREKPDLVIADFAAVPAGLAADAIGIPWVTTIRPPFVLETGQGPPSYLGGLRPMDGAAGAMRDAAGWALVRAIKSTLGGIYGRDMARIELKRLRPDGSEAIYSPLAILATTMAELEFTQVWPKHLRFLGPGAENPERLAPLDLPPGRPRVLVTLGTHIPWAKRTLVDEVRVLAEKMPDVTFVVSLGDSNCTATQALKSHGLVHAFGFVPYVAELPNFDAVIHHGGAGIVYAAIAAEKPSLACPQDYDQFDYAARIEHFQLGAQTRRIGSADAAKKLRHLLAAPPAGLAGFAAAAKRYRPREDFIAIVSEILETGGLG